MDRLNEPSTWAGIALVVQGAGALVTSKGMDPNGMAALFGGIMAIWRREGGR